MTFLSSTTSPRRRGFSLTEILIVIALIVLILALSLPAFNFITGSRSTDAAQNQISAMLARARTEAVGVQEVRGVMFYVDPVSDRQMMVLVKEVPAPATPPPGNPVDVWLDALPEDHIALPKGVALEVINDNSSGVNLNRYMGYNPWGGGTHLTIPTGGVILFDGYGRLASQTYGYKMFDNGTLTTLAKLIAPNDPTPTNIALDPQKISSNFGFVLFDEATMRDVRGSDYRPDPQPFLPATEVKEETWIDQNATTVLINRYNGTLVKGE